MSYRCAAILTPAIARGSVPEDAIELGKAMDGTSFVKEAAKCGFDV